MGVDPAGRRRYLAVNVFKRPSQMPRNSANFVAALALVLLLTPLFLTAQQEQIGVAPAVPRAALDVVQTPYWSNSTETDSFTLGLSPSSTYGVFGLTLNFNAILNLTGGSLDVNSARAGSVAAFVPADGALVVSAFGASAPITVPNLIGDDVNIGIPGLSYTVPIVDVSLGLYLSMQGSLVGASGISGDGSGGVGSIEWTSSGAQAITVASGAAPGQLESTVSDIKYDWSFGLIASGCAVLFGCYNITLLPYVSLGSFSGSQSSATAVYAVDPRPSFESLSVVPSDPSSADTFQLAALESGGAGVVRTSLSDLPSGCHGSDSGATCSNLTPGVYQVNATAIDQQGITNESSFTFNVASPPPPPGVGSPLSLNSNSVASVALPLGVVAAAVGVTAFLLIRRARRRNR